MTETEPTQGQRPAMQPFTDAPAGISQSARLWMLLSPTLPIGGFSFSHGLESACVAGAIHSSDSAGSWILGLGSQVLAQVDLPLLLRLRAACSAKDRSALSHWNDRLLAQRESQELLKEDLAQGAALRRLYPALGIPVADSFLPQDISLALAFAYAGEHWRLKADDALAGYAWIWFEQQVSAATRLVPLGHSEAQALLTRAADELPVLVLQAKALSDEEIGWSTPGLGHLSSLHEVQPSRQFRS